MGISILIVILLLLVLISVLLLMLWWNLVAPKIKQNIIRLIEFSLQLDFTMDDYREWIELYNGVRKIGINCGTFADIARDGYSYNDVRTKYYEALDTFYKKIKSVGVDKYFFWFSYHYDYPRRDSDLVPLVPRCTDPVSCSICGFKTFVDENDCTRGDNGACGMDARFYLRTDLLKDPTQYHYCDRY